MFDTGPFHEHKFVGNEAGVATVPEPAPVLRTARRGVERTRLAGSDGRCRKLRVKLHKAQPSSTDVQHLTGRISRWRTRRPVGRPLGVGSPV